MKRRFLPLLLSLCLLCSLLPAAFAQEEPQPVTALCVTEPRVSAFLDEKELQLLCRQATGHELESVSFAALPLSVGTLTCKGEPVTAGGAYYVYEKPLLSQVSFTPYSYLSRQFTGQAELAFTMTDEKGTTVPGKLLLSVPEETEPPAENNHMDKKVSVRAGQPIPLMDFLPDSAWRKSRSTSGASSWSSSGDGWYYIEEDLTSAVFQLPLTSQGSLWLSYNYSDARKVLPGQVLYPDREPNFYDVTFVPASGETATVRLTYTASCAKSAEVPGSLTLNLNGPSSSTPSSPSKPAPVEASPAAVSTCTAQTAKSTEVPASLTLNLNGPSSSTPSSPSKPAPVEASPAAVSTCTAQTGLSAALYQACASRELGSLQTVTFDTLPTAKEGTILSADLPVTAGTPYPYSALAFLPGESFQGGITLRYVGSDSMNLPFPGTLTLALDYPPEGRFQDLNGWEWAAYAAQFLDREKAVPYSKSDPFFRPGDPATRMELVYALVQVAYPTAEKVAAPGFSGLPDDVDLAGATTMALAHGLLQGDEEKRLFLDGQVTRQDALVMIHRALTDLGREEPGPGDLSGFSDAGDLSPYAREAAESLYARGVLRGDGSGRLNPLSPITRAEMACLVYRAFG